MSREDLELNIDYLEDLRRKFKKDRTPINEQTWYVNLMGDLAIQAAREARAQGIEINGWKEKPIVQCLSDFERHVE